MLTLSQAFSLSLLYTEQKPNVKSITVDKLFSLNFVLILANKKTAFNISKYCFLVYCNSK